MAERLDFERDIDLDQKWYDWGDFLGRDPKCVPAIVNALPAARGPEDDTLRTLAVARWLTQSGFMDAILALGFDEEGNVAYCPHRQPFLRIELTVEDMSTRPELISRHQVNVASTQPLVANTQVAQWLPFSDEFDTDEIMDAHYSRMDDWDALIHQQEIAWFSKDTSCSMGVVFIESPDGEMTAVLECTDEIVKMPLEQRKKLFCGEIDGCMSPLSKAIDETLPHLDIGPSHTISAYFAGPSEARRATMQARMIDENMPTAPIAPRGPRL